MNDSDARARQEIEALNVEFWYRVDHQNGEGVAELFCEDGVYSVAGGPQRRARGHRRSRTWPGGAWPSSVSRHVHSNLRLTVESPTPRRAACRS